MLCGMFFGSIRRRHTRCALVTRVLTCALPIYPLGPMPLAVTIGQGSERCSIADTLAAGVLDADHAAGMRIDHQLHGLAGECVRHFEAPAQVGDNSQESIVGKE